VTETFKDGDRVQWKSSGNIVTGKIIKKLTQPIEIKGHHVAASEDNPEYLVKSDKTGKEAAHKPEALQKID
jgi:Hypervirulence associated proteins TUDOR domain